MNILAIDPANIDTAYVLMDSSSCQPIKAAKVPNEDVRTFINYGGYKIDLCVIERVAGMGMAVGKEVFETCEWVGRFAELCEHLNIPVEYIYRREEKLSICGTCRAKDTNIRQALIDKFARHDFKNGKGTKSNPDFFYGFAADMWAAFAVGYTYLEKQKELIRNAVSE